MSEIKELCDALAGLETAADRVVEMARLPDHEWEEHFDDLAWTGRINLLDQAAEKARAILAKLEG